MSRTDYALSIALHLLVLISAALLSSYTPRVSTDLYEVTNVSLRSLSLPAPAIEELPKEIEPMPTPTVPQAVEVEDEIASIIDVKTIKDEAQIIPKPKEEPKPKEKQYQPEAIIGDQAVVGAATDSTTDVSENVTGSKFGGATVDNASFNYPYWFDMAFRKIERNWSNPVYASAPISCTIYFQVISSGRIIKIEIEKSSGINAFDGACKKAVERSKPLPPLPPSYADELLGVHLVFPYSPR